MRRTAASGLRLSANWHGGSARLRSPCPCSRLSPPRAAPRRVRQLAAARSGQRRERGLLDARPCVAAAPDAGAPPPLPELRCQAPRPVEVKRLDFRGGEPQVPIRLMEGRREVRFSPRGGCGCASAATRRRCSRRPRARVEGPCALEGTPAVLVRAHPARGVPLRRQGGARRGAGAVAGAGASRCASQVLGALYGIAGKVIDNRRYLLLLDEPLTAQGGRRRGRRSCCASSALRTTLLRRGPHARARASSRCATRPAAWWGWRRTSLMRGDAGRRGLRRAAGGVRRRLRQPRLRGPQLPRRAAAHGGSRRARSRW